MREPVEYRRACPQNVRLRDAMGGILGYARVSTGDQDVAGQTMRPTESGAIKVFGDVRSGRTMERPGLEALLAYAREGDTLAVVRLDRLGRSLGELLTTVAMLKERGIALLSLEERIDTNSAAGELVFHVFGAIAHFERRLIAERTKDGIAAARAKGKHPGRRPLDADKIAAVLSLVKAGLSPTAAAKQLGLGRSTVYREVNRAGIERYPAGARSLETAVGFASGELGPSAFSTSVRYELGSDFRRASRGRRAMDCMIDLKAVGADGSNRNCVPTLRAR